jgi:hypothetical protein
VSLLLVAVGDSLGDSFPQALSKRLVPIVAEL